MKGRVRASKPANGARVSRTALLAVAQTLERAGPVGR